jgi:sarcosine oxidase subunit beta
MCVDLDTGVLIRREPSGGYVIAYSNPDDPPSRELTVDPAFFEDLAGRIGNRFPFLEDVPIDPGRCWAGLYAETPDHHAVVGESPEAPRFLQCVGFGGHGVMHSPAAGRAIAELVTLGRCETFDLQPLRPTRFAEGDLVVETAVL